MPRRQSFSYKFLEYNTPKGVLLRPVIPVTIEYPGHRALDTNMIVDSGADFTMIDREFAEQLGIPVGGLPTSEVIGSTGGGNAAETEVRIVFSQRGNTFDEEIPVQIPLRYGHPRIALLGREPVFYDYDVSFRMGYTATKGKFVLSRVTRRRDPRRYS